jgi:hypothetical protein
MYLLSKYIYTLQIIRIAVCNLTTFYLQFFIVLILLLFVSDEQQQQTHGLQTSDDNVRYGLEEHIPPVPTLQVY